MLLGLNGLNGNRINSIPESQKVKTCATQQPSQVQFPSHQLVGPGLHAGACKLYFFRVAHWPSLLGPTWGLLCSFSVGSILETPTRTQVKTETVRHRSLQATTRPLSCTAGAKRRAVGDAEAPAALEPCLVAFKHLKGLFVSGHGAFAQSGLFRPYREPVPV